MTKDSWQNKILECYCDFNARNLQFGFFICCLYHQILANVPNPCIIFISLGLFCYCLINTFTLNSYSPHRILCFLLVWVYTWKSFCGSLFRRGFVSRLLAEYPRNIHHCWYPSKIHTVGSHCLNIPTSKITTTPLGVNEYTITISIWQF